MIERELNTRGLTCCTICKHEIYWHCEYYSDTETGLIYCYNCMYKNFLIYGEE